MERWRWGGGGGEVEVGRLSGEVEVGRERCGVVGRDTWTHLHAPVFDSLNELGRVL